MDCFNFQVAWLPMLAGCTSSVYLLHPDKSEFEGMDCRKCHCFSGIRNWGKLWSTFSYYQFVRNHYSREATVEPSYRWKNNNSMLRTPNLSKTEEQQWKHAHIHAHTHCELRGIYSNKELYTAIASLMELRKTKAEEKRYPRSHTFHLISPFIRHSQVFKMLFRKEKVPIVKR